MQQRSPATALSTPVVLLLAFASGLSVANVYFAQPLLDLMAGTFGIAPAAMGVVMTAAQVGYGLGLILLVPLGDLLDRRRLIVGHCLLTAGALLLVATAPTGTALLIGMAAMGFLAVVAQTIVSFAAVLADPARRGRIVGTVTSGIVVGILLARTISGALADFAGWRAVYFLSAALACLTAIVLYRVLPAREPPRERTSYPRLLRSTFRLYLDEPVLRVRAVLGLLIFATVVTMLTPMVLPLSAPPWSLSRTEIGLFGLAGAAGALGSARAGRLADRGRAQWTTGMALLLMLVAWLPIWFLPQSLWALIVGVLLLDFGLQAVHVTNLSLLFQLRAEAHSRLNAAYMVFYSIGSALGAIGSTMIYAHAGWNGVCAMGATLSAVALLFWYFTRHIMPRPQRRQALRR